MSQTVQATFDGQVFKPEQPLELAPNTRVLITIEAVDQPESRRGAFLRTARSLKLEAPADWSETIDDYLYDQGRDAK
jgi:predicted DNA-binding antitoxin AbrB/MazE fold protein